MFWAFNNLRNLFFCKHVLHVEWSTFVIQDKEHIFVKLNTDFC